MKSLMSGKFVMLSREVPPPSSLANNFGERNTNYIAFEIGRQYFPYTHLLIKSNRASADPEHAE
jgi:hypothetical protein